MYWQSAELTFLPDIFKSYYGRKYFIHLIHQFHIHLIHISFIPAVYIILEWIEIDPDIIYWGGGGQYESFRRHETLIKATSYRLTMLSCSKNYCLSQAEEKYLSDY